MTLRLFHPTDKDGALIEYDGVVAQPHYDTDIKPFHELSVSEYITLAEAHVNYESTEDLAVAMETIYRFTGVPKEVVREQSVDTIIDILRYIHDQVFSRDDFMERFNKVHEALSKWEEEHEGNAYTKADAQALMEQFTLFRDRIEVDGRVWTAPDPEFAPFGKWVDLQGAMNKHEARADGLESEAYVAALSAMMVGDDGPFPVQGTLSDEEYNAKTEAYMEARREVFMRAKWVDVMGCAAFFFSKSQRFAGLTSASMSRFQNLQPHRTKPVLRIIPSVGASTSS